MVRVQGWRTRVPLHAIWEKGVLKLSDIWFRILSNARFLLRSRNTMGYGIHSPYLFYIARAILPETAPYYCFAELRERGEAEARNYGNTELRKDETTERRTYGTKERKKNEMLFRLVNLVKAETIVEVGHKGIRTAYLQAPNSKARVLTDPGEQVSSFKIQELGTVDFAVMSAQDGMKAFEALAAHAGEKSLFVVDDIRESKAHWKTWQAVEAHPAVTARMDLGQTGLVFFDPHFPKQTFRIRV